MATMTQTSFLQMSETRAGSSIHDDNSIVDSESDASADDSADGSEMSYRSLTYSTAKEPTSRGKKKQVIKKKKKEDSVTKKEALEMALARQCNLHTLAADAARQHGDSLHAQEHYEAAATAADKMEQLKQKTMKAKRQAVGFGTTVKSQGSRTLRADEDVSNPYLRARSVRNKAEWQHKASHETPERAEVNWGAAATLHMPPGSIHGGTKRNGYLEVEKSKSQSGSLYSGDSAALLAAAGYDTEIKQSLSDLFRKFSGRAPALTREAFTKCLRYLGCPGDTNGYFSAFDRSKRGTWLDLTDFVIGWAALDPLTPHTGRWRAERARYIFRYYTRGRQRMSQEQLTEVVDALAYLVGPHGLDKTMLDASGSPLFASRASDIAGFVELVTTNKLRGTSRLLRFSALEHL